MYLVQYLHNKTTTRVPDPGPTVRLVGTMAQDSVQKERKKKDSIQKRKEQIHMLLKARSSLKKKKHKYRSISQKMRKKNQEQCSTEKDKAYTTQIVWKYTSELAKKEEEEEKAKE